MTDLTPLPPWKQRRNAAIAYWRRTADRRSKSLSAFASLLRRLLTLAISVLGGTLISYGAWTVYPAAGFIIGGALLWAIQWNYGSEEGNG